MGDNRISMERGMSSKLSLNIQHQIAELTATRPYDGRRVEMREKRGGWRYTGVCGVCGVCTRRSADGRLLVVMIEDDPDEYWPVGMEILVQVDSESVPVFMENSN